MNLEEIKAAYNEEERERARKDPWVYYVLRPISPYMAYPLIKWKISANQVTFVGLGVGLGGCGLLAFGHWMLGAILVNLYAISDCVDGTIARATGTTSKYGARIDGTAYMIILALLFTCVGIGLYLQTGILTYLLLGMVASFIRMLRYAISFQAQLPHEGGKPNILIRLGMIAITIRDPLLLISALTGALGYFVAFYVLVHSCELLVILSKIAVKR